MSRSTPRLFGTDGVRGRAGEPPLDAATVRRIGAALARAVGRDGAEPRVLIGRDPRESGPWLERELARGATAGGARVTSAGVLPTPAVAYLVRRHRFDAGVVISASHNPYEDNGIKVFTAAGTKASDELEAAIEARVREGEDPGAADSPIHLEQRDFTGDYLAHLRRILPDGAALAGLRLAIDCAHGATSDVAPRLLRALGIDLVALHYEPDGRNINARCGSTAPEGLARTVVERGCQLGVAFDGDGDRAIFVDHRGRLVDGDAVLLIAARYLRDRGRLPGGAVVATVMSNLGLERGLAELGLALVRCPVGDRFVAAALEQHGLALGGEPSGHIIFTEHLFTGDGLVTTLVMLRIIAETGQSLAELASAMRPVPQVLVNVPVRRKEPLERHPTVSAAVARVEARLAGRGRLLVRYSGTEPLLRVMLEGHNLEDLRAWAQEIAEAARRDLA